MVGWVQDLKWHKFYEALSKKWGNEWQQEYVEGRRVSFGRWICRRWNLVAQVDSPEKQLPGLEVVLHEAVVALDQKYGGFVHGGKERKATEI